VTIILGGDSLNKTVSPKEQDARYMFFFHYPDFFLSIAAMSGCDRMATPLGTLGLSFAICLFFLLLNYICRTVFFSLL